MKNMDYEKKYKEALERTRKLYLESIENKGDRIYGAYELETIFPELKESEDERIRKDLVSFLWAVANGTVKSMPAAIMCQEWIAWLEKQKEQKPKVKSPLSPHELTEAKNEGIIEGRQDVIDNPERFDLQKPVEWSEEKEKVVDNYADEIIKWEDAHKDWDRQVIRATAYHFFNFQPKQEQKERPLP